MLTLDLLDELTGVRHAFFTRRGGVSSGPFDSLNCGFGSGDDAGNVAANRARAMARLDLPPAALVTAWQSHSPRVRVVERAWAPQAAPKADAMVTRAAGIALGILSADCAPVLLADREAGVAGAAHAGWRGALRGVLEATVEAMRGLGAAPERLRAVIGPCIAQASYEVGPEFPGPFLGQDPENRAFFRPAARHGHHLFDLAGYVERRLMRLGLERVERARCDTVEEEGRFFSYRRATLRGEPAYGRGLSVIALDGA